VIGAIAVLAIIAGFKGFELNASVMPRRRR
jgi:hypothetical protein